MSAGAVSFYPVAYTVTLLVTFGIVSVLSAEKGDAGNLEEYRGAFVLGGLAVLLLWFGVYSESLLNLIRTAMGGPGYAG